MIMNEPMLSVICPFYNEEENIKEFYERLTAILHQDMKIPWEIIFVNDGSTDKGAEILKSLAGASVTLLNLDRNYGLSTGFYAGIQAAHGDILATLDTDLQNPPEELPRLLRLMDQADMVTGVRAVRQDSWIRKISSKTANAVRRWVLGDTILDSGCSLRIFKRNVASCFYPYKNIHRYFPGLAQIAGFKVLQVPVEHHPRLRGQAKYNVGNRLWIGLWDVVSVRWVHSRKITYNLKG